VPVIEVSMTGTKSALVPPWTAAQAKLRKFCYRKTRLEKSDTDVDFFD
jgi:hypothetical protein